MLDRPAFQPNAAIAAYAEPLLAGRAAVVFGDSTSGLAELLLERGARLVHVYDPDAARAAEQIARQPANRITIAPLGDAGQAVRDGAFDVAVIDNLGAQPDAALALRQLRRTLSPRGVALIASPNPEVRARLLGTEGAEPVTFDYYGLYDAVAAHFDSVRMLGQTPFVGYAIVDFAPEGEISPVIDTDFLPSGTEEPEWYIALGAGRPQALGEFTVVQLPFAKTLQGGPQRRLEEQLRSAQAAERRARARVAELEAEREKSAAKPAAPEVTDSLYKAIEQRDQWIAQLEARAVTADTRADEAEAELEALREATARESDSARSDADALRTERERLAQEREAERERLTREREAERERLTKERDAERERLTKERAAERERLTRERDELASELESLRKLHEEQRALANTAQSNLAASEARIRELAQRMEQEAGNDLSELEAQLKARGAEVRRLERELKETERLGRELLAELPPLNGASAHGADAEEPERPDDLRTKLDALAALNAEREADLAAARWAIDQLEARLEELQEHARHAASSAESSTDLAQAQALLQRQEVLLEQARAELREHASSGTSTGELSEEHKV